jgi:hypothetical protein
MTGYLTLLGPTTAATVYTTAKATITITIAKAKSFSMVSLFFSLRTRIHFGYVFAKKVPAHVDPASWGPDGDTGVGGMRVPSAAIQTDQAVFISTYRALRLPFKVKGRQH